MNWIYRLIGRRSRQVVTKKSAGNSAIERDTTIEWKWTQRTGYLFIEAAETGVLVHTNLPMVECPHCKAQVTDAEIDTLDYATHRCGSKIGK